MRSIFPGVEVEATVGSAEELPQFLFADEFFASPDGQEAVAEEIFQRLDAFHRHLMETSLGVDQAGRGEDVDMGVIFEVVPEGLDPGDGGQFPIREIEPDDF